MVISVFGRAGTGKTTLLKQILKELSERRGLPVYYWSPFPDDNPTPDFRIKSNSVVGISEFHIFCNIYKNVDYNYIFTGHRHLNLDIVIDSQRPALVPRVVTALSSHIYCFNITEKRDIEYLKFLSDRAYLLPKLGKFKYIDILEKNNEQN